VRSLRRTPREVYRVYDEDEFFADPSQQIPTHSEPRGRWIGLVGGVVLVAGAVGVFGGLLLSGKRLPSRNHVSSRGDRVHPLVAMISRKSSARGKWRRGLMRRSTMGVDLTTSPRSTRVRQAERHRAKPAARAQTVVAPATDIQPEVEVARTVVRSVAPPEFGFER
jgi:hypothetical protein